MRPDPNGDQRHRPCMPPAGRMQDRTPTKPITHTPLDVHQRDDAHRGDVDTNVRMPKRVRGRTPRDPVIR